MKERVYFFDNIKFIIAFLVILAHFGHMRFDHYILGPVLVLIHSFIMPAFLIVTGYYTKTVSKQRLSDIDKVLYPYLIFQTLNYIFTTSTGLGVGGLNFFAPTYQNWFLMCLFWWRLIIPYAQYFTRRSFFCILFIVAVYSGFYLIHNLLEIYRMLYFFPFFALGYYIPNLESLLDKFRPYRVFFFAIFITAMVLLFCLTSYSEAIKQLLLFGYHPAQAHGFNLTYFLTRFIAFWSSLILGWCFLYLVPRRRTWFTKLGKNVINVYLTHMFIVWPIAALAVGLDQNVYLFISVIGTFAIAVLLSQEFVNKLLAPLMDFGYFRKRIPASEPKI
ncbi:MAG TPA: acyltransferase family protein [Flavobacterium sp.]|jgi:fucose 4-O-acetylase-like acetyltransferase